MAYILSLKLDAASFAFFDELRREHFPAERNFLSAHLTLFHSLAAPQLPEVRARLRADSERAAFPVSFPRARFLGYGTCVEAESPELLALRKRLADGFGPFLVRQDQQPFRPHVTIQNKVPSAKAKEFYAKFSAAWVARQGRAEGLLLWEYLGGPWRLEEEFLFSGN